jgi:hypothetical protein
MRITAVRVFRLTGKMLPDVVAGSTRAPRHELTA